MGWTGGQYSLYRLALAAGAASALVDAAGRAAAPDGSFSTATSAVLALGLVPALVALAVGLYDALAALVLAAALLGLELYALGPSSPGSLAAGLTGRSGASCVGLLLLLHTRVPRAPFGAFEARHRTDPRGDWQRPAWMTDAAWGLLLSFAVVRAFHAEAPTHASLGSLAWVAATSVEALAIAGGLASRRARASVWIALSLWRLALSFAPGTVFATGAAIADAGPLLLLVFAAEPGWWCGRSLHPVPAEGRATGESARPARLFYDGDCGFCHRSVRFILAEELATPAPLRLRFAPLGSVPFRECLARHPELEPARLPDSIVLELEGGAILTRSAAALEIASRLGGVWRLIALFGQRLPSRLLDAGYDAIARVRKRLFAQPKDACPILPPELRARFDS